jgi:hypothetical protein
LPTAGDRVATAQDARPPTPLQHFQRYRLGGGGKRAVERGEIFSREVEFECSVIFPHMGNAGRLRNGHNTVMSQYPGQCDLRGRCVVPGGHVP